MTYVLEIINSLVLCFSILVSCLTLSSAHVVHLDIRAIFLCVCYNLCVLFVKLTSVLVMQIKNLESCIDLSDLFATVPLRGRQFFIVSHIEQLFNLYYQTGNQCT